MIKVSVIIPVYNGEKYIKNCLDSVVNQTLKDIQIIIINDGSKDNTKSIIEDYYNKYPDIIKIVNKENEGQGKARNIGIGLAQGEFITFVDADDTIESNMLEKLYNEEADVVLCDYYEIVETSKKLTKAIPIKTDNLKKDFIVSVAGPCSKLIRTSILTSNNLFFLDTGIYEDIAMIPLIGVYANKIVYVEEPLYNYYIRKGSTMRQNSFNNKLLSIYNVLETLTNGFNKSGYIEQYKEELEFIYIKHLLYAGIGRFIEYKEGKDEVKKIVAIIKEKYPNWRKNQYYKKQSTIFKLNCNIFYTNNLFIILLFQKLKNIVKRGKQWTN
jgi:hypothetical protein